MTPRETVQVIEAASWRLEQAQRGRLFLAWHVAALSRQKKLMPLEKLLRPPPKPLRGPELEKRRKEFEEMKAIMNRARPGASQGEPRGD